MALSNQLMFDEIEKEDRREKDLKDKCVDCERLLSYEEIDTGQDQCFNCYQLYEEGEI